MYEYNSRNHLNRYQSRVSKYRIIEILQDKKQKYPHF
jgi:hypothetical protein